MQLNKFKKLLEIERDQILRQAELAKNSQEIDCAGDEVDQLQAKILINTNNQLIERNNLKLTRIELALKRIAQGNFGDCMECGEQITEQRLLVNPIFNLCVGCAETAEIKRKRVSH